ncbi:MAG: cobyric acid synthase CobQ [Rhodospirillaceae bacterium]|nr:cobyric acid synthase CobQ [Rhodospirillaceae bacterium]
MTLRPRTPAVMLQGTGSDVGKSLIVAGLARLYARQGLAVRPFKPQNMSNNAAPAMTRGAGASGEIGRAQALQARAAGVTSHTDMNPVLLKPQSDIGAQLIVNGRVRGNADARDYHALKPGLMDDVTSAYDRLAADADLVLIEGAGSPAEVNLRVGDIANMGFAEAADVPVLLVGDIERGGVIAALVGTWTLLSPDERARLKGYIVNRFRGDVSLFNDAPPIIARHTGMPSLGILPWLDAAQDLPAEDTASLAARYEGIGWSAAKIRIAVPHLPRIANFDDLDPLAAEPDVALRLVTHGEDMPADANLILLCGSKSTRTDMQALHDCGWAAQIDAAAARGAHVIGICGGYQMLGRAIADPHGIEGPPGETRGLGLLNVETVIASDKKLAAVTGSAAESGATIAGFEMHMGETTGPDTATPMLLLDDGGEPRPDGAQAVGGRVAGSYVHGLFSADTFRQAFLARLNPSRTTGFAWNAHIEVVLERLADHIEEHLDTAQILETARRA